MSVLVAITAPTGETAQFRFPSKKVDLNARAALLEHGFHADGLQRWLEKYGRYVDDAS